MTQISVGTTPVQLPVQGSQFVLIQNQSTNDLYVDTDPAVTSSTGYHVAASGGTLSLPSPGRASYYAVASADGSDVRLVILGGRGPVVFPA